MAFVSGPRQVGKTTTCRAIGTSYLNWDSVDDRRVVLRGPAAVAEHVGLEHPRERSSVLVFDELHKDRKWKNFLKGFFDVYGPRTRIIVTGSSRLDITRRGSDSLMGRYFCFRTHPWSVGECARVAIPDSPVRPPQPICDGDWAALLEHGGFPEPFLLRDLRFTRRWRALRQDQLTKDDLREVAQIQDLGAMEALALLLAEHSAQQLVYSNLSREVGIVVDTARRWVDLLARLHYGFLVRHLRDKLKREVDFLIVRDRKPWFLVEVKNRDERLSDALGYFQQQTQARHAFQVVIEKRFENADCFARTDPVVVPARTLLSQLL